MGERDETEMFRAANDNVLKENYLDMRLADGFICEQLAQTFRVSREHLKAWISGTGHEHTGTFNATFLRPNDLSNRLH